MEYIKYNSYIDMDVVMGSTLSSINYTNIFVCLIEHLKSRGGGVKTPYINRLMKFFFDKIYK